MVAAGMKSFSRSRHVHVRGQGEGKGRAEARHGRMTRQMLYAIDRPDGKVAGGFIGMRWTAECRVLDVCDIFIVGSPSSLTQGIKFFFGHFQIVFFPLVLKGPPFLVIDGAGPHRPAGP